MQSKYGSVAFDTIKSVIEKRISLETVKINPEVSKIYSI